MKKITFEEFQERQKKAKKTKYNNKKVWIEGCVFDSTLEGNRYKQLKLLEKNGCVQSLELQPTFLLNETLRVIRKGKKQTYRETVYKADFSYIEDGKFIVEDVKGQETNMYKLKRKLFLSVCEYDIFREYKSSRNIIDYVRG